MKKTLGTLVFVGKFAVAGLALAFLVLQFAPNFSARVRAQLTGMPVATVSDAPAITPLPAPPVESHSAIAGAHEAERPLVLNEREQPGETGPVSYSDAVARAAPGVVSIFANKIVPGRRVLVPNDPVIRRMFGVIDAGPVQRGERSLGSGVVVRSDGYVLTNNHVIEGAEDIEAMLNDGRVAKATRVGTDPETDLAVLKLDIGDLTNLTMAPKRLLVGDVVLAIGNPFGHGNTVTMGIVSGLGRQLNLSTYEDFIQTDAAINEGNSGGALINAYGELVGINTAFKRDQMAEGIGFAIPAGTAKNVLDQIVANGKVIRGWMGAEYTDMPLQKSSRVTPGVLVQGVYDKSPAALAGLQPGDVLLRLNNDPIAGQLELHNREASMNPGTKVQLAGVRDGNPFTIEVTLQERPQLRPKTS